METGKIFGFHLYRNYRGIPVYATNFRIIPFPKWNFFSGKMETLLRKCLSHNFVSKTGLDIFVVLLVTENLRNSFVSRVIRKFSLERVLDIIGSERYGCEVIATWICDKQCVLYKN